MVLGRCVSFAPPTLSGTGGGGGGSLPAKRLERWKRQEPCTHRQQQQRQNKCNGDDDDDEVWIPVAPYRRSAAGTNTFTNDNEDHDGDGGGANSLRDLPTLLACTHHLFECVFPRLLDGLTFLDKYSYLNDRLRQVKKELTIQTGEAILDKQQQQSSSSSASSSFFLDCCDILESMIRFYILSSYLCFGCDSQLFDRSMNQDRIEDCLQQLLACYPHALRQCTAASTSDSSTAPSSSSSTSSTSSVVSSLLARQDRFRSYSILSKILPPTSSSSSPSSSSWLIDLQTMVSKDDATTAPTTTRSSQLTPHLRQVLRICTSIETHDYATFFTIYKRITDPKDDEYFDPIKMALMQPHLLPLQIIAIRRISSLFTPKSWFPLYDLSQLLALPHLVDASILCKSLCGLIIRRPEEWEGMSIEQQESRLILQQQTHHATTMNPSPWAVSIRTNVVCENDPIVFRAWYQREWKRRIKRFRVQREDNDDDGNQQRETSNPNNTNIDIPTSECWSEIPTDDRTSTPAASSSPPSSDSSSLTPFWSFFPDTIYDTDYMTQWVNGR